MRTIHLRLTPHALATAAGLALAFALGAWSRGPVSVHAAPAADPLYQFTEAGPSSALTLYSAPEHAIYVYLGVNAANSHVNCAYRLVVTRVGAPIDRQNCAPGALF